MRTPFTLYDDGRSSGHNDRKYWEKLNHDSKSHGSRCSPHRSEREERKWVFCPVRDRSRRANFTFVSDFR